eukprot:3882178-Amphidinium_carterae.2
MPSCLYVAASCRACQLIDSGIAWRSSSNTNFFQVRVAPRDQVKALMDFSKQCHATQALGLDAELQS